MKYIAKSKSLTITEKELQYAAFNLLWAIKNIRELASLPFDKYERKGPLTPDDYAQKCIIDAANAIGIDLGAEWGEELDVRDIN
jgi:hypothetical protein